MGIKEYLAEMRAVMLDEELSPRFLKITIAVTVVFLVAFGILSYIIVFVILGY